MNYAKALPRDTGGAPMQDFPPARVALATTALSTGVSSMWTLNPNATLLEVAAPNVGVALKWIAIGATQTSVIVGTQATANFDHVIPQNMVRKFVIPQETMGQIGGQVGSVHGLYQRVAVIPVTTAVSSVLATEF